MHLDKRDTSPGCLIKGDLNIVGELAANDSRRTGWQNDNAEAEGEATSDSDLGGQKK